LIDVPRSNKSDVNLLIKYTDDSLAANETFYFSFGDERDGLGASGNPITTNDEGFRPLGKLKKGVIFTISNQPDRSDCNRTTTVTDRNLYEIYFPYYTSYRVLVVNQFDEPMVNEQIIANDQVFTTDETGRFEVDKIEYFPDTIIELALAADTDKKARFELQKDTKENDFTFVLTACYECNLYIKTMTADSASVPDWKLQIEKDGEKAQYSTDGHGELTFNDLPPDTAITVVDWSNPENRKKITILRGDNHCDLIIELPKEKQVKIKLLDLTGNPMKGIALTVNTKAGVFTQTTDLDGCIHLPASKFNNKEKIKVNFSIEK